MAKKRITPKSPEDRSEDKTVTDHGQGALIAALDQHESGMRGKGEASKALAPDIFTMVDEPTNKQEHVPFRVFEQLCPMKWDQLAGFKSHVKQNRMMSMTMPEWHEAFTKFMGKPIQ